MMAALGVRSLPSTSRTSGRRVSWTFAHVPSSVHLRKCFFTRRPLEDRGVTPIVLVVFDDLLAEARFLGVARNEMRREGVHLPLWISHRQATDKEGPLGRAWRASHAMELTHAFFGSSTMDETYRRLAGKRAIEVSEHRGASLGAEEASVYEWAGIMNRQNPRIHRMGRSDPAIRTSD